ncbi:MAG: hypothetical protein COB46_08845 [Rhodospirillaceae bacterium]|nr:MAG: hypothetical protein COB46_08845 [Rhodospirillaceae bacterium]
MPKSTPKIDLNPKAGQTHVGTAQQTRNLKAINQQRDLAAKAVQTPQKAPLTLNQKIEATTKKMNATHIAEQKAKMPASQQAIYNDLVAKAKAGRQKILVQQATPQAPKPLGTASPTRSTEVLASAAPITKSPTSKPPISDERIGKEITAIKAEKPEARPSYNQLKAEATTRIEAKDAVAYSQSETPAPEPKTVEMDMDKSLETLRNGSGEDVQALVGQLKEMKDKKVKLPPELKRFHEGYTDHKAKQSDLTPPTQRIDQSDQSFAIAQRQHARQLARQETEAISAGMNAAKNNFIDALYGANLNTYVDLMAGAGALTGNPRSAGFIKAMKGIADKNVAKNYGKTTSAVMGRMFGGGADRGVQAYPGTGFIHAAGTTATKVGESGASMKEVTRQARGAAGANLLGGKLPAGSAVLFRAIKAPKAKSLLDYTLKGGEKALGYAAEKGLKGTMGGVEKGKSPSKPKIRK